MKRGAKQHSAHADPDRERAGGALEVLRAPSDSEDAIASAPESVRAIASSIRVRERALPRHRFRSPRGDVPRGGEAPRHPVTDRQIAESIVENNLQGIDINPRAIQIAAATIYLKANTLSKDARPRRVNLVAPVLQLGSLPESDPAVGQLRAELKEGAGIPEERTSKLLWSVLAWPVVR